MDVLAMICPNCKIYTVTAYRWGNREKHSYVVGVYSTKEKAIFAAVKEETYRGGIKYRCQILEWELDNGKPEKDDCIGYAKEIRGLDYEYNQ